MNHSFVCDFESSGSKMVDLCTLAIIFAASCTTTVSSAFLSDGVLMVQFERVKDGSDAYEFKYETDNGRIYNGTTLSLVENDPELHLHLLFGVDDVLYWIKFTLNEFENENSFCKMVRLVKRGDDSITMMDDFVEYSLEISKGLMLAMPYQTRWDFERICFTKYGNMGPTFNYTISATNNSRKFNGTTYFESEDPLVQLIHMNDGSQRKGVYQVVFTDDELNSTQSFCRGITKVVSESGVLGARPISNIDPKTLKSLVG